MVLNVRTSLNGHTSVCANHHTLVSCVNTSTVVIATHVGLVTVWPYLIADINVSVLQDTMDLSVNTSTPVQPYHVSMEAHAPTPRQQSTPVLVILVTMVIIVNILTHVSVVHVDKDLAQI